MQFSLVLVLNQFGLKKTCQVTFQPEAEVRVKSKSLSPSVWLAAGPGSGVVINDLPRLTVACHSSLRCSSVCAHLQTDDSFAFVQLFIWEFPLVLLCFSANIQSKVSYLTTAFHKGNIWYRWENWSNSPMKPVGVSFVIPIFLCHSQTPQSHQGPLDRSQVFAWRHTTITNETQAPHIDFVLAQSGLLLPSKRSTVWNISVLVIP